MSVQVFYPSNNGLFTAPIPVTKDDKKTKEEMKLALDKRNKLKNHFDFAWMNESGCLIDSGIVRIESEDHIFFPSERYIVTDNILDKVQKVIPCKDLNVFGNVVVMDSYEMKKSELELRFITGRESAVVNVMTFDEVNENGFGKTKKARDAWTLAAMGHIWTYHVRPKTAKDGVEGEYDVVSFMYYDMDKYDKFLDRCKMNPYKVDAHLGHFLQCRSAPGVEFFFLPLGKNNFAIPLLNRFLLPLFCTIELYKDTEYVKISGKNDKVTFVMGCFPFVAYRKILKNGNLESTVFDKRSFNLYCCMECYRMGKTTLFHRFDSCAKHIVVCDHASEESLLGKRKTVEIDYQVIGDSAIVENDLLDPVPIDRF